MTGWQSNKPTNRPTIQSPDIRGEREFTLPIGNMKLWVINVDQFIENALKLDNQSNSCTKFSRVCPIILQFCFSLQLGAPTLLVIVDIFSLANPCWLEKKCFLFLKMSILPRLLQLVYVCVCVHWSSEMCKPVCNRRRHCWKHFWVDSRRERVLGKWARKEVTCRDAVVLGSNFGSQYISK